MLIKYCQMDVFICEYVFSQDIWYMIAEVNQVLK